MTDLADEYRRVCRTPSDIVDHLPTLVDRVVDAHAMHVVELGVRDGNSTIAFLYGLTATGGQLTSIDCAAPPDIWAEHWRFIHGDDLNPAVIEQVVGDVDVLFIDTVHTYAHTCDELAAYGPLVREGGTIIMHDTELVIDGEKPVLRAMSEYADTRGYPWVNDSACGGLGTVYVT